MEHSIKIYPWDTEHTIRYRLGREVGTFPMFLDVQDDLSELLHKEETATVSLRVINLLDKIRDTDLDRTALPTGIPARVLFRGLWELKMLSRDVWERWRDEEDEDTGRLDFDEFMTQMEINHLEDEKEAQRIQRLDDVFDTLDAVDRSRHFGWTIDKHRLRYRIRDDRSLGKIFDDLVLDKDWLLAVYHDTYYAWGEKTNIFGKIQRHYDPRLVDIWKDGIIMNDVREGGDGVYIYHIDLQLPVVIRRTDDDNHIHIEIEVSGSGHIIGEVLSMTKIMETNIQSRDDIGMTCHFSFRDTMISHAIFQDACMNDPVISTFFEVNESRKTLFDTVLPIMFRPYLQSLVDCTTTEKKTHMIMKNIHRQTGFICTIQVVSPISKILIPVFIRLIERCIGYTKAHYDAWIDAYTVYLPKFREQLDKDKKNMIKNIKGNRPEYLVRYPRLFIKNLYSIICQRNLQPVLLTEDEIGDIPKERFIRFPQEKIEEIEPEYYYCPNDDYPFAGLKEMSTKGKNTFINLVPCCFNSPQEKENINKLRRLNVRDHTHDAEPPDETNADAAPRPKKENIISGKFLIKHPGQLGTIRPPTLSRFLLAIDPFRVYYRIGIEQSPSSLLSCLLTRRRCLHMDDAIDIKKLRRSIADDPHCAPACVQENPGMSIDDIRKDIENPDVYFDPRRFYRAVELFFGVRLVVFTKSQKILEEDVTLQYPLSMRSHYADVSDLPVVIIFEHWGGKINILSQITYPHCELIVYKTPEGNKTDFTSSSVFDILSHARFQYDGAVSITPFQRQHSWFSRHIVGQFVDPIGKVRRLVFEVGKIQATASVYPPISVQNDIPLSDDVLEAPVHDILCFLSRFDSWVRVSVPDPSDTLTYWTVRQDRVFGYHIDVMQPLYLTFAVRLASVAPLREAATCDRVSVGRSVSPYSLLLSHRPTMTSLSLYQQKERAARCLLDLSFYTFSLFLKEYSIHHGGVDPDVVLDSFRDRAIVIDGRVRPPSDISTIQQHLIRNGRLILPSVEFWRRVRYIIKWTMLNVPSYLKKQLQPLPSLYRRVYDFSSADAYIFHLDAFDTIFRHAIENHYEVNTQDLENTSSASQWSLWYNHTQSPSSSPLWVRSCTEKGSCLGLASVWYGTEELSVYEWSSATRTWRRIGEMPSSSHRTFLYHKHTTEDEWVVLVEQ